MFTALRLASPWGARALRQALFKALHMIDSFNPLKPKDVSANISPLHRYGS